MRKREISSLDRLETSGRESGRMTEKAGRKGYLSKSGRASSRRRRQNAKANAGKKRQEDSRQSVFKLADFLTDEEIKRLKGLK